MAFNAPNPPPSSPGPNFLNQAMAKQPESIVQARDQIQFTRFDYQITFDQFSRRPGYLPSPTFSPPGKVEPKFMISLNTRQQNVTTNMSEVALFIKLSTYKYGHLSATVHSYAVDARKKMHSIGDTSLTLCEGSPPFCLTTLTRSDVIAKGYVLPNDSLTIYLKFGYYESHLTESEVIYPDKPAAAIKESCDITADYERVLSMGKFTDVVLVCGRTGKEVAAHKAILSVRSPLLLATLETEKMDMLEVQDVSEQIFDQFVRYLYTGKVTELEHNAQELLAIADKYQLNDLKSLCEEALCTKLSTPAAVSELLVLADKHNAAMLKSNALDYFQKNPDATIKALFSANKSEVLLKTFRELSSSSQADDIASQNSSLCESPPPSKRSRKSRGSRLPIND